MIAPVTYLASSESIQSVAAGTTINGSGCARCNIEDIIVSASVHRGHGTAREVMPAVAAGTAVLGLEAEVDAFVRKTLAEFEKS